jgi:hypothetical protein
MILETLQDIKQACSAIVDLQMIDLDRGQLDSPEDYESILQPALLVVGPDIDWQELNHGNQSGTSIFGTKTVVRLPQHTAFMLGSEAQHQHLEALSSENLNELLIEDAIHQEIIKIPGVVRIRTREYPVDTFWVVEHTYEHTLGYENIPRYQTKTLTNAPGITVILEK